MKRASGSADGAGQGGVTSLGVIAEHRMDQQLRLLQISEMFHRKLDLQLLLDCLYTESQVIVPFDALSYQTPDNQEVVLVGNPRQYTCKFELELAEENLGEIVFQSARAFSDKDQRELEKLVALLLYPIKNALEFRHRSNEAMIDSLTGILNAHALEQLLPREMIECRRAESPLSLMIVDLDHFHKTNESHGHEIGDELILTVAETLTSNLREEDYIFRLEQDCFAVLLGETDFESASTVSERLRTSIDTCFSYDNVQLVQNASAGVTEMVDSDTAETLIERAQTALLNAKRAGRNRIRLLEGAA